LPYRVIEEEGLTRLDVLLVTSRETGRWVLPKGNVEPGLSLHASARIEAEEEAGVSGWVDAEPIGEYRYAKRRSDGREDQLTVAVYPLCVTEQFDQWKESRQRQRRWLPQAEAAIAVDEPDLKRIIAGFVAG
jgi:hypothetical protein